MPVISFQDGMSSPSDPRSVPPSPERRGFGRAVIAPQLAAALEQTFTLQGYERRKQSVGVDKRSPSEASKADGLNDLGMEWTPTTRSDDPLTEVPTSFMRLPTSSAWRAYFMQEVAGDKWLEAQLLLMTVVTGMLDAMTYTTYHVFTSKQTGNTLFLALYAFRVPALGPGVETNVGVSIGVFIAGAIFFGHIGHISRQRRRIWLLVSNAFQALLMLAAAAVRYWVSRRATGPGAMAILALLSFAESGQIANALNVAMPELNTTMITGALIQLCTDKKFFQLKNAKRNRRLAFFASMMAGCFIGAGILAHSTPSAALVITAATKGILFFSLLFNRGMMKKKKKKFQLEDGGKKVEGAVTPVSKVLWGD